MNYNIKICIVGVGYVGLPLAMEFDKKNYNVIAYDIDKSKISALKYYCIDITGQIYNDEIMESNIYFTDKMEDIKDSNCYIITVPTPVDKKNKPNLEHVISATKTVSKYIKKGDFIIYESTVCPKTTRSMIDIINEISGLKCIEDYKIGFSHERVSPNSDKKLTDIVKVVSGIDEESLDFIHNLYSDIIQAGVHKAESIEVAEMSKILENTQRDVNIALMNQFSKICSDMEINMNEVLESAKTKWNFVPFEPGLSGGHCIPVDPYYLIDFCNKNKIDSSLLESSREINNSMSDYVVEIVEKRLKNNTNKKICIFGASFKENCSDIRNSMPIDIYKKLINKKYEVIISDYICEMELYNEMNIKSYSLEEIKDIDYALFLVKHDYFYDIRKSELDNMFKNKQKIVFDAKNIFDRKYLSDYKYDSL